MFRHFCKSKIHRATVTEANLNYVGSITLPTELMETADIMPYEKVQIVDIDNGTRLETYAIPGNRKNRDICVNGAAARLVHTGDKIIIITYCMLDESEQTAFKPKIIFVDEQNKIQKVETVEIAYNTFLELVSEA